jgi:hypothetical protein
MEQDFRGKGRELRHKEVIVPAEVEENPSLEHMSAMTVLF